MFIIIQLGFRMGWQILILLLLFPLLPSTTSATPTSVLSPEQMMLIDMRVEELKYAFDHDIEMSDKDCEDLAFINYCERMQVFEPFEIKQWQVIDALKKYGIIELDRPELANYSKEESIALRNILLSIFEQIDFDMKVIFHAINGTLPHWGYFTRRTVKIG